MSYVKTGKRDYKGLTLEINYDEYVDSPRDRCNISKLATIHDRYNMPNDTNINLQSIKYYQDLIGTVNDNYDVRMMFGVSMYDHSGISISIHKLDSISRGWDNSVIGICFVENNDEYKDMTDEMIMKYVDDEIKQYNQYLKGSVYQFCLYGFDGEMIDSCCGFYDEESILDNANLEYNYLEELKRIEKEKSILEIEETKKINNIKIDALSEIIKSSNWKDVKQVINEITNKISDLQKYNLELSK